MSQISSRPSLYSSLIEAIFFKYYHEGDEFVSFAREDIIETASRLNLKLPKNLGDVIYSFRYRKDFPKQIIEKAREGKSWVILSEGRSRYQFALVAVSKIIPNQNLLEIKIPDSTPGLISKYSLTDEQALLAILRYNRLIDVFTSLVCFSLQNHLRTTVQGNQIETDEIYIGVDNSGVHYVLPVQAKGGSDQLGIIQIEQDIAMCANKFPHLVCRPIASQFMTDNSIALFEFCSTSEGIRVVEEKHYRLVDPEELSNDELNEYKKRLGNKLV